MIRFGSGVLIGTQKTDASGAAVTNATPVQFGVLQEVSLDISFERKQLHGQNQFAYAVARGKGDVSIKAKFANVSGRIYGDLVLGSGTTAGIKAVVANFAAAIPTTPFTVTMAPPSSGTFATDLGVVDVSTGRPMKKVASAPATGQYSVAGAVYTFAAADTGKSVLISYEYSATSTVAQNSTLSNMQMGYSPTFSCHLTRIYGGNQETWVFPKVTATKLGIGFKNDDFSVDDVDLSPMDDGTGNIGYVALSE